MRSDHSCGWNKLSGIVFVITCVKNPNSEGATDRGLRWKTKSEMMNYLFIYKHTTFAHEKGVELTQPTLGVAPF